MTESNEECDSSFLTTSSFSFVHCLILTVGIGFPTRCLLSGYVAGNPVQCMVGSDVGQPFDCGFVLFEIVCKHGRMLLQQPFADIDYFRGVD